MKTKKFRILMLALALPMVSLLNGCVVQETPCYYGYDGNAGRAFMGIDWVEDTPGYLWTNNGAIPHIFQYGAYYQTAPATYELYYEGEFIEDCCPKAYYWNVTYDVWYHPGTAGGCGYSGVNGADSYLMLLCGPYGPANSRMNKTETHSTATFRIVSKSDDTIVAEIKDNDVTVFATWKKLEKSRKGELNPSGEIIAQ